jgi:hypothetical protein
MTTSCSSQAHIAGTPHLNAPCTSTAASRSAWKSDRQVVPRQLDWMTSAARWRRISTNALRAL